MPLTPGHFPDLDWGKGSRARPDQFLKGLKVAPIKISNACLAYGLFWGGGGLQTPQDWAGPDCGGRAAARRNVGAVRGWRRGPRFRWPSAQPSFLAPAGFSRILLPGFAA